MCAHEGMPPNIIGPRRGPLYAPSGSVDLSNERKHFVMLARALRVKVDLRLRMPLYAPVDTGENKAKRAEGCQAHIPFRVGETSGLSETTYTRCFSRASATR
jgi:hypothetical protein